MPLMLKKLYIKKDIYDKEPEENLEIIDTPNIKTIKQLQDSFKDSCI